MKWFDEWFYQKWQWAYCNRDRPVHVDDYNAKLTSATRIEDDPHDVHDGLRVAIKKVIGGSLVTFSHYDKKHDRHDRKTYIITSEQDFNTELGKIITMESLR